MKIVAIVANSAIVDHRIFHKTKKDAHTTMSSYTAASVRRKILVAWEQSAPTQLADCQFISWRTIGCI
jgi:hypothetical protein